MFDYTCVQKSKIMFSGLTYTKSSCGLFTTMPCSLWTVFLVLYYVQYALYGHLSICIFMFLIQNANEGLRKDKLLTVLTFYK